MTGLCVLVLAFVLCLVQFLFLLLSLLCSSNKDKKKGLLGVCPPPPPTVKPQQANLCCLYVVPLHFFLIVSVGVSAVAILSSWMPHLSPLLGGGVVAFLLLLLLFEIRLMLVQML